jgi:hypothetical protein
VEQQEFNSRVLPDDLPVIEGVDAHATLKEELMLLARYGDDGTWRESWISCCKQSSKSRKK